MAKRLLLLAGTLMAFLSLTAFFGGKMTKFEWQARDSAPEKFPMEIIAANLIGDDGADHVPGGSSIAHGWGRPISVAGDGRKRPLPRVLDILFFSYTEDQFYRAKYALPYNEILKRFQEGFEIVEAVNGERKRVTYDYITVGVAPGGVVAVWLQGRGRSVEVMYHPADKVNLPWDVLAGDMKHISREAFVEEVVKAAYAPDVRTGRGDETRKDLDAPQVREAYAALKKNGPPLELWDRYRTRYAWKPEFINMPLRDNRIDLIDYYNGEQEALDLPLDATFAPRSVPSYVQLVWKTPQMAIGTVVKIFFNEAEVFKAFEKLGRDNQPLKLEFRVEKVGDKNRFTISLKNDKEKIEFDHHELKTYAAKR